MLYLLAILGWITLGVRIYMKVTTSGLSLLESMVQFVSYFTILTNLLITIYCTVQLLPRKKQPQTNLFLMPETLTALTVLILLVGAVYHVVLKSIWNPEGLDMVTSEIHHTLVPLGTFAIWIFSTNNNLGHLKNLFTWLLYPILYFSFVVILGSFSGFYPYPFMNVAEVGIGRVMENSFYLLILMGALFLVFHFIEKKLLKRNNSSGLS